MKKHVIVSAVFIGIVAGVLLFSGPALAAWGQRDPVPEQTEHFKNEVRRFANTEFSFDFYRSSLDKEQIKAFYRQEMPRNGWVEYDRKEALEKVPEKVQEANVTLSGDYNPSAVTGRSFASVYSGSGGNSINFRKDQSLFIVNFLPEGASHSSGTTYSTCSGKVGISEEMAKKKLAALMPQNLDVNTNTTVAAELGQTVTQEYIMGKKSIPIEDMMPELVAKPKRNIAPVYPQARLIGLSESVGHSRISYMAAADIEDVAAFYREKMLNQGWFLSDEQPIEDRQIDMNNPMIQKALEKNPEGAKLGLSQNQAFEAKRGKLMFTDGHGNSCSVGYSSTGLVNGPSGIPSFTTILVNYEQK